MSPTKPALPSQRILARLSLTAALSIAALYAQTSDPAAKFELASVYPSPRPINANAAGFSGGLLPGGRYQLRWATMLDLVRTAWDIDPAKVLGGPSWLDLDHFEIRAKVPPGTTAVTVKPMLRALLKERFALAVRDDTRPVNAWVLTASKHPQLKQSDGGEKSECRNAQQSQGDGNGRGPGNQPVRTIELTCHNMTMEDFAAHMSDMPGSWNYTSGALATDQTELKGAWDFDLRYSQRNGQIREHVEILSLFDAIDRLGLKLDPGMAPMPVVVVDSVNRLPTPDSPEATKAFPSPPTEFEVATVKMSDPDQKGINFQLQPGGRLNVRGATLQFMIEQVMGVTDEMLIGAPKFLDVQRWDIVAKAPDILVEDGNADFDTLLVMVKSLLAERFGFRFHFEEKPVQAYTLTAPKPKMKKADPNSRTGCKEGPPTLVRIDPRNTDPVLGRLLSCTNASMAYLADQLQYLANGYVHSAVLDSTGLDGGYDFTLSFSTIGQFQGGVLPDPGSAASDPNGAISLPTAMEKQLGLKMELVKRPIPVLVIDHIEEKPNDN
jgi:uncharacterized protein (TIGR03435 family)